jgi:hypothetical protein
MSIMAGSILFEPLIDTAKWKASVDWLKKSAEKLNKNVLIVNVGVKLATGAIGVIKKTLASAFNVQNYIDLAKYSIGQFSKEMQGIIKASQQYGVGMDAAAEALKTSEITGMRVKDVIRQMSGGAKEIPAHMKKTSEEMRRNAENSIAWNKMIADVNDQFKRLGGQLLDVIAPAFSHIVQAAQDIGDIIQEYVMPILKSMANIVINTWTDIGKVQRGILALLNTYDPAIRSVASAFRLNLMDSFTGFLKGIQNIFSFFKTSVTDTISWLDRQIMSLPIIGAAYEASGNALKLAADTVKDAAIGAVDAAADAVGFISGQSGDDIKDSVSSYLGDAAFVLDDVVSNAASSIETAWTSTYSSFERNMNRANDDYAEAMKDAGQQFGSLLLDPPKVDKWEREVKKLTDMATTPRIEEKKENKLSSVGTFSGIAAGQLAPQGTSDKILDALKDISKNTESLNELPGIVEAKPEAKPEAKLEAKPDLRPLLPPKEMLRGVSDQANLFAKALPSALGDFVARELGKLADTYAPREKREPIPLDRAFDGITNMLGAFNKALPSPAGDFIAGAIPRPSDIQPRYAPTLPPGAAAPTEGTDSVSNELIPMLNNWFNTMMKQDKVTKYDSMTTPAASEVQPVM